MSGQARPLFNARFLEALEMIRTLRILNPVRHKGFLAGNWPLRELVTGLSKVGVLQVENAQPIDLPHK
jgi:hypothetical protein